MNDIEELIVSALRTQADRRPDGTAVRAALNKAQSHQSRRLVLVVAAAVAVAAIAVTVPLVAHRETTAVTAVQPSPHPAPPLPPVTEMSLEPQWLPAHAVEMLRSSSSESFTRTWIDGGIDGDGTPVGSSGVSLGVGPGHLPANGTVLTINGKPAMELTSGLDVRVVWELTPGRLVTVTASLWQDKAGIAERVAKSVRPAGTTRFASQLRFGPLPAGWTAVDAKVFGSKATDAATQISATTTYQGHLYTVVVGRLPTGHHGLVTAARDGYPVRFGATKDKPDGTTRLPGWPDFSGVLAAAQVVEHADVSWIGTR